MLFIYISKDVNNWPTKVRNNLTRTENHSLFFLSSTAMIMFRICCLGPIYSVSMVITGFNLSGKSVLYMRETFLLYLMNYIQSEWCKWCISRSNLHKRVNNNSRCGQCSICDGPESEEGYKKRIVTVLLRYTLRCLVAVKPEADCVKTIQTAEAKLADKKKELEKFQVIYILAPWGLNWKQVLYDANLRNVQDGYTDDIHEETLCTRIIN